MVGVVTRRATAFNADFVSLEDLATANAVPCYLVEDSEQAKLADWLTSLAPNEIYCIGCSSLLKADVLRIPPFGVVGYHPAALPKNRVCHPIIWALALRLQETATTFFLMDEGADSGDILVQRSLPIEPSDDASSLYDRLVGLAKQQIVEITQAMASERINRTPQDARQATYWRKRLKADGLIDWRMSVKSEHSLVRVLAHPYPSAHCIYRDQEVKIWRFTRIAAKPASAEPGKILVSDASRLVIAWWEGALDIVS